MPAIFRFLIGLAFAAVVFVVGLRFDGRFSTLVDPFLILAVYHSLRHDPLGSAVGGSAAGLVEDALTGGLYGLHGFANTAVAYSVSWIRQRFVIQEPGQVGILCFLAAAFQGLLLSLLQASMVAGGDLPDPFDTLLRMITTGFLGALVFVAAERFFAWEQQYREKRSRRLRLDT